MRYIKEEDIASYFYLSDFVFLTHTKSHIGFSGPLSLAVEHERPVIASNIGAIGYFIKENKNGCLFQSDDWNDFIKVTNEFINQLNYWKSFDFRKIQLKNSWKIMASQMCTLY